MELIKVILHNVLRHLLMNSYDFVPYYLDLPFRIRFFMDIEYSTIWISRIFSVLQCIRNCVNGLIVLELLASVES